MIHPRQVLARNYLAWFACVVLAALIQTNWPEALRLQEVSPDIVIVLIVYFAIAYGEERAMFTGVVGGLYQDVAVNTTLGHHVLCYVVIGYIIGRLATRLISEHAAVKAGLVLLAGFCQGVAYITIQYAMQPQRGMLYPILNTAAPIAFYSAIITPFVFAAVDRIFHKRTIISDGIV
ncbi:MAG TPA: rod shape-determining protein MreD [Candidatus Hydrogenedentes bacterium]|nr:rod shape-determining protein MreD [Candidatus Hydrogenedentota bacterium]